MLGWPAYTSVGHISRFERIRTPVPARPDTYTVATPWIGKFRQACLTLHLGSRSEPLPGLRVFAICGLKCDKQAGSLTQPL